METPALFSLVWAHPDQIAERVRADLELLAAGIEVPDDLDLGQVAEDAVRRLWDSPVKQFVPVLALRDARERVLQAGRRADEAAAEGTSNNPEPSSAAL